MSLFHNKRVVLTNSSGQIHRDTYVTTGHYAHRSVSDMLSMFVDPLVFTASFIITTLLGLRFLLSVIGANLSNLFAHFIYTVSTPLVAPFVGLFNYQPHYGISNYDFESLVALVVYGIIAWRVVALVNSGSDSLVD